MVIAKNAAIDVKIDHYTLNVRDPQIMHAVRDVMALFSVEKLEYDTMYGTFTNNVVMVYIEFPNDLAGILTTKVFYKYEKSGSLLCDYETISYKNGSLVQNVNRLIRLQLFYIMRRITEVDPGPWGILRGVRPIKIAHRLLDDGLQKNMIINKFNSDYAVDQSKAELMTEIAIAQRRFFHCGQAASRTVSIYIGIPYCPTRCLYCSFPGYPVPSKTEIALFLQALYKEIYHIKALIDEHTLVVENIYVGGGTPTSLDIDDFTNLLELIQKTFFTSATKEFTVEAGRPDSLSMEKIEAMARYGVTRTSINPQTMQEKTLKLIGRKHTIQDIIDSFAKMRTVNIPIINMDIIIGLPGETEADVLDTMEQISVLQPNNLTVHTLAIKKGSQLKTAFDLYSLPNERIVKGMLEIAATAADEMGMKPYYIYRQKYMTGNFENIGYCKPGSECIYNIQMIGERQTIIGIGPTATTRVIESSSRFLDSLYNPKDLDCYQKKMDVYLGKRATMLKRLFSDSGEE